MNYSNQATEGKYYEDRAMPKMAVESRQAEIPSQMERLERTLKGCMQGLESLGMKLEASVMRPETSNDAGKEPNAVQSTTLGGQLQNLTQVAAAINSRIQSMAARLEV